MSGSENSGDVPAKRGVGRPFQPGQSGNPGGRPAVVKRIRETAQAHGEEAIAGLLALARDPEQAGAVRRASWADILDRGFGKPTIGEPDEDGRQAALILQVLSGVARGEGD